MPYAWFQLLQDRRKQFIDSHKFFVQETKRRLLSQFDNLEGEAKKAEEQWLEDHASSFNPEYSDSYDYLERAYFHGIDLYQNLSELYEQAKLLLVAGMYHQWEKTLKKWLVDETMIWHKGDNLKEAIWRGNFEHFKDLWRHFGWDWVHEPFYTSLDACRLLTNVHMHGDGSSLVTLRNLYPQYFDNSIDTNGTSNFRFQLWDHQDVKVTIDHIDAFSTAICAFWNSVPVEVFDDRVESVPTWFETAFKKDKS